MSSELIHIGFGNILSIDKVVAISPPVAAPIKRIVSESRHGGNLVDMTSGRKTKSVIFTTSGHIILAALSPETIAGRTASKEAKSKTDLFDGL